MMDDIYYMVTDRGYAFLKDNSSNSVTMTRNNNKRYEYTFTWLIENYSYCLQKNKKVLESPMFIWDVLNSVSWRIQLYPRGFNLSCQGHISIFLKCWKTEEGQRPIPTKFELSLLAADGSAVISKELDYDFKNGHSFGYFALLRMSDLFSKHKDALLPKDTLSVRCKMWINGEGSQKFGHSVARTRIRVRHLYFLHVVKGFSAMKPKEKNTFFMPFRGTRYVKARLQLSDSSLRTLYYKITFFGSRKFLSTCNLFLVGESGVLTKCLEGDNRADAQRNEINKLPLSLTRYGILAKKEEYLPDDKLTLFCHCTFSSGVRYEKIEKAFYNIPPSVLNQINNNLVTEKPSVSIGEVDDLIKL